MSSGSDGGEASDRAGGTLVLSRLGYGAGAETDRSLGTPEGGGVAFGLGLTGKCLRFAARFPPGSRGLPGAGLSEFKEGLWEHDVAELFIADPDPGSGRYVEFNLSPVGAWWVCGFSAPRLRDRAFSPPPVSLGPADQVPELWIDLRGLGFSLDGARANVTAIVGGVHFSWCHLGGQQPDFHRPQDFVALELPPGPGRR